MKTGLLAGLLLLTLGLRAQPVTPGGDSLPAVRVVHLPELESWLGHSSDTLYVVNFWATWCKPCVAELPYFDQMQQAYAGKPVRFLLVSMDFVEDLNRVRAFVQRRQPQCEVVLLDEPKYHLWIDKVSPEWSGAIPATIAVRNGRTVSAFHEAEFTPESLRDFIEKNIASHP